MHFSEKDAQAQSAFVGLLEIVQGESLVLTGAQTSTSLLWSLKVCSSLKAQPVISILVQFCPLTTLFCAYSRLLNGT